MNENANPRNSHDADVSQDAGRTRASLLMRLKDARDNDAWAEFYEIYSPLLYHYARSRGLQHSDAEDFRGECLEAVARQISDFNYDRSRGGFRLWLRTLAIRRIIDRLRSRQTMNADSVGLNSLADSETATDELWDQEWRHQHLKSCMYSARRHVSEQTWTIFEMIVDRNIAVSEVCEQLGITAYHVYKARSRVLEFVRERMQYLQGEE